MRRWADWPLRARAAAAAAVTASVVVLALLLWALVQADGDSNDGPIGGLREGDAYCVQAVDLDPQLEQRAGSAIKEALPMVDRLRASFTPIDNVPDSVDVGCPIGPELRVTRYCPPYEQMGGLQRLCGRSVKEAGRYTLLIYIMPQDEIDRVSGRAGFRVTTEESKPSASDTAQPTSKGLYLGADELEDADFVRYWLYWAAGVGCYIPDDEYPAPPTPAPWGYCDRD